MSKDNILSKKKKGKILGALLPQELFYYVNLNTLSSGFTKTDIVKNLLLTWQNHQITGKKKTVDALIEEISATIKNQWENRKSVDETLTFDVFCHSIKLELYQKGIKEEHVDLIIEKISE